MAEKPTPIDILECYRAVFRDWLAYHPEDQPETVRDLQRIALGIRARGPAFYSQDLPALSKLLERGLDEARLRPDGSPLSRGKRRGSIIPRFLWGFWSRVFDSNGHLRSDVDPNVITFLRFILNLVGKLKLGAPEKSENKTLKEFYDVEANLPPPSGFWEGYISVPLRTDIADVCRRFGTEVAGGTPTPGLLLCGGPHRRGMDGAVQHSDSVRTGPDIRQLTASCQQVADRLVSSLGDISPYDCRPRHGPGAVSEGLVGSQKYEFPTWSPQLEELFPFDEFGTYGSYAYLERGVAHGLPSDQEGASRLIAVPKTRKAPRLIAAEPTSNQWIQQGVSDALRERVDASLLGRMVSIRDQNPSRALALQSSRTCEYATVDLSSASDRLSCLLVEAVFRSNHSILRLFRACRTRYLENRTWPRFPKLVKLGKFATMGSALTFPVQSIVFSILALGVGFAIEGGGLETLARKVRVYGDDIIVPVGWYPSLRVILEAVGLKVNMSKSFARGQFRESCGMDAWNGYNVTPVRLRQPSVALATREALGFLDTVNNLWLGGYWHTSKALERTATFASKLAIVNRSARAYGLVTFSSGFNPSWKTRWNRDLQRFEAKVHRVSPVDPKPDRTAGWNDLSEFLFRKEREISHDDELRQRLAHLDAEVLYNGVQQRQAARSGRRAVVRSAWVSLEALCGVSRVTEH